MVVEVSLLTKILGSEDYPYLSVLSQARDVIFGVFHQPVGIGLFVFIPGAFRQAVGGDGVDRHGVATGRSHRGRVQAGDVYYEASLSLMVNTGVGFVDGAIQVV
jgi:hypothetical protein